MRTVRDLVRQLGHKPPGEAKERLIFALDVDHIDEAERLVKLLAPHVGMFKVGPRLFTSAGSLVLDLIHGMGSSVFLDLKFHDIPDQVAGAAREVARQRARMFTLHALGGGRMISAVIDELAQMTLIPGSPPPIVLAVTVLTSHSEQEIRQLGFASGVAEQAQRLASMAMDAGASGLVASGHELPMLKKVVPESTVFVVPGIRGPGDEIGDQSRVMTAREAVEAGATYVVVGRPIRTSDDPVGAAKRIVADIEKAKL
jgi:orotidine-5'-phosphate decarboxylase